jgi:hypothetical protein
MTSRETDLQAVLERLEKLERQNLRLKRVGFVVVLLLVVWIAIWEGRRARKLEAQEFVLRDARGMTRARLAVNGDFTDLSLLSENGKRIASLTASG